MLNLLLTEEKKEIKKEYVFRYVTIFFFGLSAIFTLIFISLIPTYVLLKLDQKVLNQELSVAQDAQLNSDRQRLKEKLADLQKTLNIVDTENSNIAYYIQSITDKQPRDINILKIDFKKTETSKSIVIQGTSNSRGGLASFIDVLETVPEFTSVNLPFSSFARDADVPFSITINITNPDEK